MWKTLLIDDEESIRKLLKAVLEMADFSVETAASAHAGIEALRSHSFDVVITDLRMETHLAGYQVAQFASHLDPAPLIALVTAFPVPASEWHRAGADVMFTKGTDTIQLASRLQRLLESRSSHSANSSGQAPSESTNRRGLS
jgi:DNA-binding NtrC family response regulator